MDAVEIDTAEGAQNEDAIESTVPEVCRVCLLDNLMMRDLFVENEVISLSTKAMSFTSVKMQPGDGLPGQVCCHCADKLDSAYEFKLQVEQADNVLRQRYDSLNIKEELFFNEVEVHLEGERCEDVHTLEIDEHYQATVDSLTAADNEDEKPTLLKDHLALLQVEKLAAQEYSAAEQKESDNIDDENKEQSISDSAEEHSQYLRENEEHNEEMADCEVYRESVKEERMHEYEGIPIDEHNYIIQQGYTLAREEIESQESVDSIGNGSTEYMSLMSEEINEKNEVNKEEAMNSEKTEEEHEEPSRNENIGNMENIENIENIDNIENIENIDNIENVENIENIDNIEHFENIQRIENIESSQSETRRSKRKVIKRVRDTDEENYFENLNLSSRLKKSQEKSDKVYFLCYICDRQFVSKDILKEHMHSHEEVRRTLLLNKSENKMDKRQCPSKVTTPGTSTCSSTPTSSGKKLNKCQYCGKEYLYVISFNKHLKQHEKNKDLSRNSTSVSFEGSIHDEGDSSDFAGYEEISSSRANSRVEASNEETESQETSPERRKRRRAGRSELLFSCDKCPRKFHTKKALGEHGIEHETSFKCSTCEQEFDELEKLRRHRSQHVVEGVLSEQDLEENVYEREFDVDAPPDDETEMYGDGDGEQLDAEAVDQEQDEAQFEEDSDNDWHLELQPEGYERKEKIEDIEKNWSDRRELKCPRCPLVFAQKKSLARHAESHESEGYACRICEEKFTRKDHLQRHVEQHGKSKSFKCTECNKIFGNELTLRNHLIATNHKTVMHGEAYDPNKRLKRVAAKAAQKIIDKIKTEGDLEEYGDEEEPPETKISKGNVRWARNEEKVHSTASARKTQHRNRRRSHLECETCGRKCNSKQSLAKHMEQHRVKEEKPDAIVKSEKGKKNSGPEGDRSSCSTQKLSGGIEVKTEEEEEDGDDSNSDFESGLDWPMDNHECPTCKKKYSTKKSLLRHQLLHEEPNFECDICNVKFYRKDKLKSHYDKCSEKNPDQVRKCNICGDSFENNEMLKEHRGKHVDEGILTEEDLREIEPDERKDGTKVARKRRTDIVGLECTECNKRYTSRKGLLRHIQVHEGKKYLCDICPKKFYRREHLKIHVAKHNMVKPYKCSRCTKRFIKEEQLANHLSKHDRTFKKTKETDSSKRFLCEICSKSFTQSTTLIAHLRAHNGIKPYVCEVCARPFTTNAYLKMHMRTHTQERPYSCQYCSRAFARADTLANHLTSHTGEAKYHCKYCPKNFRRLKSLKEHVFIHTGQRPYSCPTCDRRFNNNGSRYAHSKRCKQNLLQNQNRTQTIQQTVVQSAPQTIRIQQITTDQATAQMQVVKSQNIKTITIARPGDQVTAHQVMQHQEILMPLILPLTVALTDVDEEVILPEGAKIFTTA